MSFDYKTVKVGDTITANVSVNKREVTGKVVDVFVGGRGAWIKLDVDGKTVSVRPGCVKNHVPA